MQITPIGPQSAAQQRQAVPVGTFAMPVTLLMVLAVLQTLC